MNELDLTIRKLSNTEFSDLYEKFIMNNDINYNYKPIVTCALILINSSSNDVRKLGYSIIVEYCNQTKNFEPLYEISMNMGLFPIAEYINKYIISDKKKESFFIELNNSFVSNYKKGNVYNSYEQNSLNEFFSENMNKSVSVIAPTSYGKTDLIISLLSNVSDKNICIITPTKSLLAQTKQRILKANIKTIKKIIVYPDMYNKKDKNIVAVLTQERLLRLLKKDSDIKFDYIVIDEAHNILKKTEREILLASVIILLEKRNPNLIIKYLTPFLRDAKNLSVKFTDFSVEEFRIKEYIKSESFFIYEPKQKQLIRYDPFFDNFFKEDVEFEENELEFIKSVAVDKNIVYMNKPKDIKEFALSLANSMEDIDSVKISEAIKYISEYIHPDYEINKLLKKGIIYHHGSVPDTIRLYIEKLYSEISDMKFVVTNSTLLEGVNLPAERLFVLDNKRGNELLSPSDFKNLIGRVCRFSDIFKENSSLNKLTPHIYLVNSKYYSSNANLKNFLSNTVKIDKKIVDKPTNVLLENTVINDGNKNILKEAIEFIENYEEGTIEKLSEVRYCITDAGKACFRNNITEFSILDNEIEIQKSVDKLVESIDKIDSIEMVLSFIYKIFISKIGGKSGGTKLENIKRLRYPETQRFYTMFLRWRSNGTTFREMISSFVGYWDSLCKDGKDTIVYVGRWGELKRGGFNEFWVNIDEKTKQEKTNLAIVRIKEEQDFLDNTIMKFIEVLNDLDVLEESLYLKIKYGTDNKRIITLIRNGISLTLSKIIVEKYLNCVNIDIINETIVVKNEILKEMTENKENEILINEVSYFILE